MSEQGTNEWLYETGNHVDPEPGWDAGSGYVDHAHGVVFYNKASEVDAGRARWPEYRHVAPETERESEAGFLARLPQIRAGAEQAAAAARAQAAAIDARIIPDPEPETGQ
jgi:hypothetical protein